MDLSRPTKFLEDGQVAVYVKRQHASVAHLCDGSCGAVIPAGSVYVRVQYVRTQPSEHLQRAQEARSVDYRRRVVLKCHPACVPAEARPEAKAS